MIIDSVLREILSAIDAKSREPISIRGAKKYLQLRTVELFEAPNAQQIQEFTAEIQSSNLNREDQEKALATIAGKRARLELVLRMSPPPSPLAFELIEGDEREWMNLQGEHCSQQRDGENYVRKLFYNVNLADQHSKVFPDIQSYILACETAPRVVFEGATFEEVLTRTLAIACGSIGALLILLGVLNGFTKWLETVYGLWLLGTGVVMLGIAGTINFMGSKFRA